ncbi:MAG: hemolysin family protein [Gemmatimonadota bacterium]
MLGTLGLLVLLILLSAWFSGSEIALFSVPLTRARALAEEGRRGAQALVDVRSDPDRLLITILIGNNVVNILAASVATYAATNAVGSAGVGIATGLMTLLILFFGEITPKSFAAANALRISLMAAPLYRVLARLLFFLVAPLERLNRALLPRRQGMLPRITEGEIRQLTWLGHQAGSIEAHERELIERALTLDTTRAWEVMTPRVEIFAWPASRRLADIAHRLGTVPYSRIPVYGDSLDDITGVVYLRDAYQALVSAQRDVELGALARKPFFVPASVSVVKVLGEFQARRIHMGIVVDEYGGTDGLITLEDILEELVGEIMDEKDVPEESIRRLSRNEIVVEGSADLREINHFFNTSFPLLEHRSLNGYLLEELGRVPARGERIERQGIRIEVLAATETQVLRARLTRSTPAAAQGTDLADSATGRSGGPAS